jgi:hypothetical protein
VNRKATIVFVAAALLGTSLPLMADQSLPAPPAGFTVLPQRPSEQAMKSSGVADSISAESPSDSSCKNAPRITLGYGWQLAPGADKTVELMAKTPQDPPSEVMGTRREPAGRRPYKNGVLQWEKRILLLSTGCPAGFTTYDGGWLGSVSGKLVTVGVSNVSSRETGQAWIDEYIDKVVAAVKAAE